MTIDLAQFHDAFFAESFDALDSMEATLLQLQDGDTNPELINTIFRVAHSIKGGAATFGFGEIASFTHRLETLLDELRSGQRPVTERLVDLLLRSVDVMRQMLAATRDKQALDTAAVEAVQSEIEQALSTAGTSAERSNASENSAERRLVTSGCRETNETPSQPAGAPKGWRIRFIPGPKLMRRGNDPLRILRELSRLGDLTVRVNAGRLGPLSSIDPSICYLSWDIELASPASQTDVREIFDWVDGDCEFGIEPLAEPAAAKLQPMSDLNSEQRSEVAASSSAPATAAIQETLRASSGDASSIRVSIEKIDELLNAVGELVITQSVLSQLASRLEGIQADETRSALAQLERHMRSLQESVMRVRMLPISALFNRFPRMVRDLGQRLGKKVELKVLGDQTELDKTVLEKIGDPLVHLVRNAIDHGIEAPEDRRAAGKPEAGTVTLNAYHKGGSVVVEVIDDGKGLDRARILAKARERGLVGVDEELSDEKILSLIFAPGFSTATTVTDISGRGVGMDVVRRNINEIGGHVQVCSPPGEGSTVRIRLPLTLAILDGQLARIGQEIFVVPIVSILETIQVRPTQLSTVIGRAELLRLRDEYIPVLRLHSLFGIPAERAGLTEGLLMIVEADGKRLGLFVDELLSQQQVVIKSLETNFRQVPGISGATMLGDGRVALILDVPGLVTLQQRYLSERVLDSEAA